MCKLLQWIDKRFPLVTTWKKYASEYYVPKNLNTYYVFGVLALVIIANQLLTGIWLTMFYTPTVTEAFDSIEYIMRDVNWGWLFRYMHSTGASALFLVIYLHMFRGIVYGSYQKPRELVWLIGVGLFILLLAEAFFGYLLPWGQMSYWGAEVITSMLGSIPWVGDTLVTWLRGDYSVGNPTLQRFFALHVIAVPLLLIFLIFLHVVALHQVGSNNPDGIDIKNNLDDFGRPLDGIPFHPYYTVKDFFSVAIFLWVFFAVVLYVPDMGGYFLEQNNFVQADQLITPEHIVPVWYMAPFYSILRTVPHKLSGIFLMGMAVIIVIFLPWIDRSPVRSIRYKGFFSRYAIWLFGLSYLGLGLLGGLPLTNFTKILTRIFTMSYFLFFLLMPVYSRYERTRLPPTRIRT
ncbi:MAG: cytochrome b [Legionella sp.]